MGSAVKKVTTLPRKIIKTVKKNPALLALAAPIAFPTAFAGVTAASSGAFLQGAAKRALIQALATKATGGDVSIKDSLIGGAVGQGIGQFAGNAAMFKGVDPKLLQAGIGAATNVGTSLARGQEIDPRSALISGGLNYLTTPGASQPSPNAMGGNIPEETITPTTTSAIEDLDAQTYNIPGYTRQFGTSESLPDALASVGENIDTSQLSNLVKTTDGKIDFLQTGYLKQIGSDLMKGNFADAADLSLQVAQR